MSPRSMIKLLHKQGEYVLAIDVRAYSTRFWPPRTKACVATRAVLPRRIVDGATTIASPGYIQLCKFGWDGRRLAAAKPRALLSILSLLDNIVLAIADATSQVCRLVRAYHKRHRIRTAADDGCKGISCRRDAQWLRDCPTYCSSVGIDGGGRVETPYLYATGVQTYISPVSTDMFLISMLPMYGKLVRCSRTKLLQ